MGRVIIIEDMPPFAKGRAGELAKLGRNETPAQAPNDAAGGAVTDIANCSELTNDCDPVKSDVFEAVLYPNRSLPNFGFALVMSVVIGANLLFGLYFFSIGAWPVIGFCGLDVALVWLAFKISYRQGRLHERVCMTSDMLWVSRVLPSGHETRWRMQPFWTQVVIDQPVRHESQLQLRSKGRTLVIGSFLSPGERAELGSALKKAMGRLNAHDGTFNAAQ